MFLMKPKRPLEEVVGFLTDRAVRHGQGQTKPGKLEVLGIEQNEKQCASDNVSTFNEDHVKLANNFERSFDIFDGQESLSTSDVALVIDDDSSNVEEMNGSILEDTTKDEIREDDLSTKPRTIVLAQEEDEALACPSSMVQRDLSKKFETKLAFAVESEQYIVDCETKQKEPNRAEETNYVVEKNVDNISGLFQLKEEMKKTLDQQSTDVKLPKGYRPLVLKLHKLDLTNLKLDVQKKNIICKKQCTENSFRLSDEEDVPSVSDRSQMNPGIAECQEESLGSMGGGETKETKKKKRWRLRPPKSVERAANGVCSPIDSSDRGSEVISEQLPLSDVTSCPASHNPASQCISIKHTASKLGSLSPLVKPQKNESTCKKERSLRVIPKNEKDEDKSQNSKEKLASPRRMSKHPERKEMKTEKEGKFTRAKPEARSRNQAENIKTEVMDTCKKSEKTSEGQTDHQVVQSDSDNDVEIITQYNPVSVRQETTIRSVRQKSRITSLNNKEESPTKKEEIRGERTDEPGKREQSKGQDRTQRTARKSVSGPSAPKTRNKVGQKLVEVLDSSNSEKMSEEGSSSSNESSWNSDSDIKKRLFGDEQKQKKLIPSRTRSKGAKDGVHSLESLEVSDKELLKKLLRQKHKRKLSKGFNSGRLASSEKTVVVISSESGEENGTENEVERNPNASEESSKKPKNSAKKRSLCHLKSSASEDGISSSSLSHTSCSDSEERKDSNSLDDFNVKPRLKGGSKRKLSFSSGSQSNLSSEESSGAVTSDSDAPLPKKNLKKKRKIAMSSTEDTDDENEDVSPSKRTGRRNLRKIMDDEKLSMETKAAQKEEQKRLQRLKELASSRALWTPSKEGEKEPRIVLETAKEDSSKVVVELSPYLVPHLKKHQVEGIRFIWDCVFESVDQACKKDGGSGCILAHCMGLGKTLQVLAIIDVILKHRDVLDLSRILIMAPKNAVNVWKDELKHWIPEDDLPQIWHLHGVGSNTTRLGIIGDWYESGGVLIVGYEMYRNLSQGMRMRRTEWQEEFPRMLRDPGPDVVVCDEGHVLRNWDSALSKTVNKIRTKRRIVLTGTPLQNNLNEYYTMVNFVKPNLLGTHREFTNRFANPISNGQHADSTPFDVRLMKQRAHVLHEILRTAVQRKDYSVLLPYLPPKFEYVIFVRLNELQIKLYRLYLEKSHDGGSGLGQRGVMGVFVSYHHLMRVWTHPYLLRMKEEEALNKLERQEVRNFVATDEETTSESEVEKDREAEKNKGGPDSGDEEIILLGQGGEGKDQSIQSGAQLEDNKVNSWFDNLVHDEHELDLDLSAKFSLLMEIVRAAETVGDKVLVFSQSLLTLNLLESIIQEEQFGGFCLGIDYYRLDGSSTADSRQSWAQNFNKKKNKRLRLFLISTRAGSLGVNLIGANRVVIMDASWNPTHDTQSLFRVYRFGQEKPVYIYRLVAQGTMEQRVYDRQVTKQSLSRRVVDERQIERHFSLSDLQELYKFDPEELTDDTKPPEGQKEPQDAVLTYLLQHFQPRCIIRYHEHSSLLEDQVDERLTDEEKKVAWEEYELEKKGQRGGIPLLQNGVGVVPFSTATGLAELQRDEDRRLMVERIAAAAARNGPSNQSVHVRPASGPQIAHVQQRELESQMARQQLENPAAFASSMLAFRQFQPHLYRSLVTKYPGFAVGAYEVRPSSSGQRAFVQYQTGTRLPVQSNVVYTVPGQAVGARAGDSRAWNQQEQTPVTSGPTLTHWPK